MSGYLLFAIGLPAVIGTSAILALVVGRYLRGNGDGFEQEPQIDFASLEAEMRTAESEVEYASRRAGA